MCPVCNGHPFCPVCNEPPATQDCPKCYGSGVYWIDEDGNELYEDPNDPEAIEEECWKCDGEGWIYEDY